MDNLYEDAGTNAPKEVKALIERFRSLPSEDRAGLPLLYRILGSGTPPYKVEHVDAHYTDSSVVQGQTCANCEYAYKKLANNGYICSWIRGYIKPEGWCHFWTQADN